MIGKICVVRTYSAGVFVGKLESLDGKAAVVSDATRIWRWSGAASLSQLAMEGVKNPSDCKFAIPVTSVLLTEAIEIIPMTDSAIKNIDAVPRWKM
jgi:hypothetical protein